MTRGTIATGLAIAAALLLLLGFAVGRITDPGQSLHIEGPEQMQSALRQVFLEPDPLIRSREMDRLMAALDEENLPGAIDTFREFSSSAETLGVFEFFARWAQIDVDGLAVALDAWPDEKSRAQGTGWVVYEYALRDGIAKAITYYDGVSGTLKLITGYRLVEGAVNHGDLEAVIEWVGAHPVESDRDRLTQSLVLKVLRERGPDGLEAVFDSVSNDAPNQFKRQIFLVTLEKLTRQDPDAAVEFLTERADEPWAVGGMTRLAVAWTDLDPPAVLSWVESRDPGPERERTFEAVIDRWAAHDEPAAIAWTRAQPQSEMIDRLCAKFVASTTIRDPDLSVELAAYMLDDEMREKALRRFARYWFNRRPEDTASRLVVAGLSEADARGMIDELRVTRERRLGRQKAVSGGS